MNDKLYIFIGCIKTSRIYAAGKIVKFISYIGNIFRSDHLSLRFCLLDKPQ